MKLDSPKNAQEFSLINKCGIKYSSPHFMIIAMPNFNKEMLNIYANKAEARPEVDISAIINRFKTKNIFLGFKVSKKVGNAVKRNNIKRKIKAILIGILNTKTAEDLSGTALVFIARSGVNNIEFVKLSEDLNRALTYFVRKFKPKDHVSNK
jgi:ribonuclease P protein component